MENSNMAKRAVVACPSCATLNRVDLGRLADRPRCGTCREALPLGEPLPASDANLERLLASSEVPVLVDFYADWCGPCKMMAPTLAQIARKRSGDALVLKLDTDRNPAMSMRYQIRGIPTLIAFAGGREVAREVGAVPPQRLEALIDRAAG
jgi:thioredoxin 2